MDTSLQHLAAVFPEDWNRSHETLTYLDRVFGSSRTGHVAVAHGSGMHYDHGRYRHRRWSEKTFAWPDQLEEVTRWVRGSSATGDVYVCPALRVGRDRLKGPKSKGSAPAGWAWVDCDGVWTVEHEMTYLRLRARGAFTVASGTGRHLYVPLEPDVDAEGLESANRGLAGLFDGDAKWAANSLLRPPGTFSWKAWAADHTNPPVPVMFA